MVVEWRSRIARWLKNAAYNPFARLERLVFNSLMLCAAAALSATVILAIGGAGWQKMLATHAGLLQLAGLFQLEVSGLFSRVIDHYSDEAEYPYGPPSNVTRRIIDDPDKPIEMAVRNALYFRPRTGFWLIAAGTMIQTILIWG